jgi:hypothetical protein
MYIKNLFITVLIIVVAILVTATIIYRQENLFSTKPEDVIQEFYDWHINYEGNTLVDKAYQSSDYLTEDFIATLDAFTAGSMMFDPILCAKDRPESIMPGEATISGEQANVLVTTSFVGHSFEVVLSQVNGEWKIDNVICTVKRPVS